MSGECDKYKLPHPWTHFLNARYQAILWMKEERGCEDKEIAELLSMDEGQVYSIRTSPHLPIPDGDYVR